MRVLSFSSCMPSEADPGRGIFVLHRLAAMARLTPLEAVHPYGRFPLYRPPAPTPPAGQEQIQGVTVYHRPFFYIPRVLKHLDAGFYARGVWPWLREYARRQRPDVLDAHFAWPDGVAVGELARRLGVPYTVTLRGVANSRFDVPRIGPLVRQSLGAAATVIAVSEELADLAVAHGIDRAKVHVIPNGVDTSMFAPRDRAAARKQLGLDERSRYVLCVAGVLPYKGLLELAEAMAALGGRAQVIVVGSISDAPAFVRQLLQRVRSLGLEHRFTLAGQQPQSRLPLYLAAADVFALPSHSEGCPNVVLEAMACGLPVVASSVGQLPRMIAPGRNGLLTPPRDAKSLAAALEQALSRTWSADEIRTSPAVVSWDAAAASVLDVFSRVIP